MIDGLTTSVDLLEECMEMENEFLSLLGKFVKIETPPADKKSHLKLFALLEKELKQVGYQTELFPANLSGGQLLARPFFKNKRSGAGQLLIGHLDTVWPRGTLEKMPYKRVENVMTGPGIYDMKSGIVMMILVLKLLQKHNLKPELEPVIFINSDEETGSRESKDQIIQLAKTMSRVYVLEPSLDIDGKLKTRRKGGAHYEIGLKGLSAHAGIEPEKGRSAIVELSYLIQKLNRLNDPEKGISVNVGKIGGGTSSNVIAAESTASVDVRVQTEEDAEWIDKEINSISPTTEGVTLEVSGGFGRPPMVQNERNRRLWEAAKEIGAELGLYLDQGISGGGSDGSYTSLHTATLDGLGAVGDGAHSPTERIFIEETLQRIALLAHMILKPDLNP